MKRLLAWHKNKDGADHLPVGKDLQHAADHGRRFIVAWARTCTATHKHVAHLQSIQEEADTKMMLHALDVTADGATEIQIHSPDTDVFILSLRRYPDLCKNTSFVKGRDKTTKWLAPIVQALGETKLGTLPALHAISGADITGRFLGKGKLACWKTFQKKTDEDINQLGRLGETKTQTAEKKAAIEKFVCQLYLPKTTMTEVKELRWWLVQFCFFSTTSDARLCPFPPDSSLTVAWTIVILCCA